MPVNAEKRSFWLFLLSLGGLMAIGFLAAFLYAAPTMPTDDQHHNQMTAETCLSCHLAFSENIPVMPHVSMPGCVFCHGN